MQDAAVIQRIESKFLLLVSMFVSTMLAAMAKDIAGNSKGSVLGVDVVVSYSVVSMLFAAIFKFLPDVHVRWRNVWHAALISGVLFTLGKYGLAIYFKYEAPTSAFGVAGSLVAVLLWVYYSSFILFFGAEFSKVWSGVSGDRSTVDTSLYLCSLFSDFFNRSDFFLKIEFAEAGQAPGFGGLSKGDAFYQSSLHPGMAKAIQKALGAEKIGPLKFRKVSLAVPESAGLAHEPRDAAVGIIRQTANVPGHVDRLSRAFAELAERIGISGFEHPLPKLGITHCSTREILYHVYEHFFDTKMVTDNEEVVMIDDV
jgi:hypothetical protein